MALVLFSCKSSMPLMAAISLFLGLLMSTITGVQSIGVCYGTLGDNLPSAPQVVQPYHSSGINKMRIYDPNPATLEALRRSGIRIILGVPNDDLPALASFPRVATDWIQSKVMVYTPDVDIWCIAVGNEVSPTNSPTSRFADFLLPAMINIQSALLAAGLSQIKVSTASFSQLLGTSFPPSQGSFGDDVSTFINPIIRFLVDNGSPFLANVYPYFSYTGDRQNIPLPYALFTAPGVVVQDGNLQYQNLFDASVDAIYAALERSGGAQLQVVVSESGWPSEGDPAATVENARTYYNNLMNHVKGGTPRRPGQEIDTYLFAMFDENQKGGLETERHFGLFSPSDQHPKYPIGFN